MNRTSRFSFTLVAAAGLLLSLSQSDAALVGLWRFEDDFTDSSDAGNDGTQQNGVIFVTGQPGFGKAASFSGNDTRVEVPHDVSLNMTSVMTISAWINADGNSYEGVVAKNPSIGSSNNQAGNYELRLKNSPSQMEFLYQRGGDNDTASHTGDSAVPIASWQHIAVTMDGTNIRFYLNGALESTKSAAAGFGAANTNPLYIGSRADLFTDFHGQMDDVAIFNEVLDVNAINTVRSGDFSAYVVPEPSTGLLTLLGLGGLAFVRRRSESPIQPTNAA